MYSVQVQGGSRRRVQHGLMNGFRSEKLYILVVGMHWIGETSAMVIGCWQCRVPRAIREGELSKHEPTFKLRSKSGVRGIITRYKVRGPPADVCCTD